MAKDVSDIYIKGVKDPLFKENVLETNTYIDTVISKIYMILMTNKGDVLGDPNFGADIPTYLWKTRFPASTLQENIIEQFETYIPELSTSDYTINIYILPGTAQDIGVIQIDLGLTSVNVLYK